MKRSLSEHLTPRSAEYLLMGIISLRATSFMFSKLCLQTMTSVNLLGLRFSVAAIVLCLIFLRRLMKTLTLRDAGKGILMGCIYFLVVNCELTGLKTVSSATGSFLENMAIIIVPLLEAVLCRRLPKKRELICALLAVCGVALLTLKPEGLVITGGEGFLLLAALFYASGIIVTSRLSREGDTLNMGIIQVVTLGLLNLLSALLTGNFTLPETDAQWGMILCLALLCTCLGFTLQPVAQSRTSSEKASLFCAISPLVAGILSVAVMHEGLTLSGALGELLILLVLIFRNPIKRRTDHENPAC